jgi:hypothetical protein
MAMLQLIAEEPIGEETVDTYFDVLYRVVCVGEKPMNRSAQTEVVRSTYIVDWEQLVHLLEGYEQFDEDIVEVTAVPLHEARAFRRLTSAHAPFARA